MTYDELFGKTVLDMAVLSPAELEMIQHHIAYLKERQFHYI